MTDFLDLAVDAVPDYSAPLAALHAETDGYILAGVDADDRKARLEFADYNVLRVAKRYDVDPDALRRAVLASDDPDEDEQEVEDAAEHDEKDAAKGEMGEKHSEEGWCRHGVPADRCPDCENEKEASFIGTPLDGASGVYVEAMLERDLMLDRVASGLDPHTGKAVRATEEADDATEDNEEGSEAKTAASRQFVVTVDGDLAAARSAIDTAMGDYFERATGYRSGWSSSTSAGPLGNKINIQVDPGHAGMVRPILAQFGDVTAAMEASRSARRQAARRRATQWVEDDGDYVPVDTSMELSVEAKNGQFFWTMYAGLDSDQAEVVRTGGPFADVREAQTEAEQAWLAREASHRVAFLDWQEMENRDDYNGWGYLNERASQGRDSTLADAVALQIAADLGWSDDDLFEWANSRSGRYYGDLAFGGWNHSAEKLRSEAERMKLFDLSMIRGAKLASVVNWANEYTAFADDIGQYMVITGSAGRFTAEVTSFPDGSYEWALVERDAVRCGGAAATAEEAMDQCEIMAYRLGTGIAGDETERTVATTATNEQVEVLREVPLDINMVVREESYTNYGYEPSKRYRIHGPAGDGWHDLDADNMEDAMAEAQRVIDSGMPTNASKEKVAARPRVAAAFFESKWRETLANGTYRSINESDKGRRFVTLVPLRFVKDPNASYDTPELRFDDLPQGQTGTVTGVESHGSNPWTRYTVKLDSGQTKVGVSPTDISFID